MAKYIPPHLRRAQQSDENDFNSPRSQRPYQAVASSSANSTTSNTPVWRRGATIRSDIATSAVASSPLPARRTPGPSLSYTNGATNLDTRISPSISPSLSTRTQSTDEAYRYRTYERTCQLLQPRPVKAEQCEECKEYARWAGGYVEITDKLLSVICPCNLVGKPCAFDQLEQGCPMIRLCGQLEKWTIYECPDKGFRTIIDAAENVPSDYGEKGFGAVNFYDSSDNESGGVGLEPSSDSEIDLSDANVTGNTLQPSYRGMKVSFDDFSCGVKNDCGHIHWEVEINCRFVGWSHYKDVPCKQVLEKSRLCSCGHDLESSRQAARDAVKDHEKAAVRAGAPQPQELGKVWVY